MIGDWGRKQDRISLIVPSAGILANEMTGPIKCNFAASFLPIDFSNRN